MKYQVEKRKGKHFLVVAGKVTFELDESIAEYIRGNRKLSDDLRSFVDNFLLSLDCPKKVNCPYELKSKPLVSVILINYNGKEYNEICLDSLFGQSYKNTEIIMVNNLSMDGSIDIVKKKYPKVKIIDPGENTGFAKGNNIGVSHAKGEYLLIVNNDTELEKDAIKDWVAVAQTFPNAGAIAGKMMFYNNRNVINSFGNTVFANGWGSDNYINHLDVGQFDKIQRVFSACFGAVLIKKSVWEKIGPLDESMFMYYEDSDWSYRARLAGYDILATPYSIIYHMFGASTSQRISQFKLKSVVRNRLMWAFQNLSKGYLRIICRNYVWEDIRNVVKAFKRMQLKDVGAYVGAYLSFATNLFSVINKRLHIQKSRKVSDQEIWALSVPLNIEVSAAEYPKITVHNIRRYYWNSRNRIKAPNWILPGDSAWTIWNDNPGFLVSADGAGGRGISYDVFFDKEGTYKMSVNGLFQKGVEFAINDLCYKTKQVEADIAWLNLGSVKVERGQNKVRVVLPPNFAVNYLGEIRFV